MKVKEFKHPIKILIEVPVNPSEKISKINQSISNLILHPVDSTETKNDKITLNFDDIQIMHSIFLGVHIYFQIYILYIENTFGLVL